MKGTRNSPSPQWLQQNFVCLWTPLCDISIAPVSACPPPLLWSSSTLPPPTTSERNARSEPPVDSDPGGPEEAVSS